MEHQGFTEGDESRHLEAGDVAGQAGDDRQTTSVVQGRNVGGGQQTLAGKAIEPTMTEVVEPAETAVEGIEELAAGLAQRQLTELDRLRSPWEEGRDVVAIGVEVATQVGIVGQQ